jgi:ribulose-phosphate 3-epimerase
MQRYKISPSILAADMVQLGVEVDDVIASGADMIHIDVMDNHYVPNLTIGPLVCNALSKYGVSVPLDVHLMVEPVDGLIEPFAKAGSSIITFHPEATKHVDRTIELIKQCGCKAGLALNPATSVNVLEYTLPRLDLVLIMTVNPGFGGQKFIPSQLAKIAAVRDLINQTNQDILLAVDGGINDSTIRDVARVGADTFVAGSFVFGHNDRKAAIESLRRELVF